MQVLREPSLQDAPFRFWCASCRPPAAVSSTPTLWRKTSSPPYHPCRPNRPPPTRLRQNGRIQSPPAGGSPQVCKGRLMGQDSPTRRPSTRGVVAALPAGGTSL